MGNCSHDGRSSPSRTMTRRTKATRTRVNGRKLKLRKKTVKNVKGGRGLIIQTVGCKVRGITLLLGLCSSDLTKYSSPGRQSM